MAFKCRECNRTWPDKDNKEVDVDASSLSTPNTGTCPDCWEEPDPLDAQTAFGP
jgi:hypothetical protein